MSESEEPWVCACGESDITKHDLGMAISHIFDISMQDGRDILVRIRDSAGVETSDDDRVFPDALEADEPRTCMHREADGAECGHDVLSNNLCKFGHVQ